MRKSFHTFSEYASQGKKHHQVNSTFKHMYFDDVCSLDNSHLNKSSSFSYCINEWKELHPEVFPFIYPFFMMTRRDDFQRESVTNIIVFDFQLSTRLTISCGKTTSFPHRIALIYSQYYATVQGPTIKTSYDGVLLTSKLIHEKDNNRQNINIRSPSCIDLPLSSVSILTR